MPATPQDSHSQLLPLLIGVTSQEVQSSLLLVGKLVLQQEDVCSLPASSSTSRSCVSQQWFFSLMFQMTHSSSMFQRPQVWLAFSAANQRSFQCWFSDLLYEFPNVVSSEGFAVSKPRHGVSHNLFTLPVPPVVAKARRLNLEKLSAMEKAGIICRSISSWSSFLHMVKKMEVGTPCRDYRRLNTVTIQIKSNQIKSFISAEKKTIFTN